MAQINLRSRDARSYLGTESTYGSTPTVYAFYPVAGSVDLDPMKQEDENQDERERLYMRLDNVQTLKRWTAKITHNFKPDLVQLTAAAATTLTLPCGILLKNALGIEQVGVGTTVASAASGVSVTATSASAIAIGSWQVFDAGSSTYVPRPVINKSGAVLTLGLNIGATPAGASIINNMYCYVPDPNLTNSITLEHAKAGDSNHQWLLNGGRVSEFALSLPVGKRVTMDVSFEGTSWTGPSAQGFAITGGGTEVEGTPFSHISGTVVLLQASTATTTTNYRISSVAYKFQVATVLLGDYGGTEGVSGVFRNGPDDRTFVTATVRIYADTAMSTNWSSQTALRFCVMIPYGSGTTRRWLVFDMPTCKMIRKEKIAADGNMVLYELELAAYENNQTTLTGLSGTALSVATAPFLIAMG